MSSRLDMAVEVSDPILCCVTPIAHKMQTPLVSAIMCATLFNVSSERPQVLAPNSMVNGARLLLYYSSGQDRMALCRVAPDDEHQPCILYVSDGARVSAVAYSSK